MQSVDEEVPIESSDVLLNFLGLIGDVITLALFEPIGIVAVAPISALLVFVSRRFSPSVIDMGRIQADLWGPLVSVYQEQIVGLVSVRSTPTGMAEMLASHERAARRLLNARFYELASVRWLRQWGDFGSIAMVLFIGLGAILADANASMTGVALLAVMQLGSNLTWGQEDANSALGEYGHVERIRSLMSSLESERYTEGCRENLPEAWPNTGALEFRDVVMRYGDSVALNQLSFCVGERKTRLISEVKIF